MRTLIIKSLVCLTALSLFSAMVLADIAPTITSVQTEAYKDGLAVTVTGKALPAPSLVTIKGKHCFIQFSAGFAPKGGWRKAHTNLTKYVQYGWYTSKPPQSRILVVLNTKASAIIQAKPIANGWRFEIIKPNPKTTAGTNDIKLENPKPIITNTDKSQSTTPTSAEPKQTQDSAEKTVSGSASNKPAENAEETKTEPTTTDNQYPTPKAETPSKPKRMAKALQPKVEARPKTSVPAVAPKVENKRTASPAKNVPPPVVAKGKLVSLNFHDAEVGNVLKALAIQTGSNILIGSGGSIKVTITLHGVTVEKALDFITKLADLKYTRIDNTYVVADEITVSRLVAEIEGVSKAVWDQPLVSKIVPIVHADTKPIAIAVYSAFLDRAKAEKLSISNQLGGKAEMRIDPRGQPYVDFRTQKDVEMFGRGQGSSAKAGAETQASAQDTSADEGQKDGGGKDETKATSQNKATQENISGFGQITTNSNDERDDKGTKYLVITGLTDIVEEAAALAMKLDSEFADTAISDSVTRIFDCKHSTAVKLKTAIMGAGATDTTVNPLFPSVKIHLGPDSKQLILQGRSAEVDKAYAILQETDSSTSKMITDIYKCNHINALRLKAALEGRPYQSYLVKAVEGQEKVTSGGSTEGSSPLFPNVTFVVSPSASVGEGVRESVGGRNHTEPPMSLIMQGPANEVSSAMEFSKKLDVPIPQIRVEARIVDINKDNLDELGFDWEWNESKSLTEPSSSGSVLSTKGEIGFTKVFKGLQIDGLISGWIKNENAKIIARPSISVLDGQLGNFFVGDEIYYIESQSRDNNGQLTVKVGQVKAGIQLFVEPRVNKESGTITMAIRPEVSYVYAWLDTFVGGQLPQVARRYAETYVRVKDGETLVIGGLIREEDIKTVRKLPLLGDLPLLGELFKKRSDQKKRSEIVIFLTTKIITDDLTVDASSYDFTAGSAKTEELKKAEKKQKKAH